MLRRDFLVRTGLAVGAIALAKAEAARAALPRPAPGADDWDAVKHEFVLDPGLVHLAGFYLASHPRPVRDAIERHRKALDENPFEAHHLHARDHDARVLVAAASYLGVKPIDIALTDSTTMGLGLTYSSLKLREGQEILQTTHDHYSTNTSLQFRAMRTGATVRKVELYKSGAAASEEEIVKNLLAGLSAKTRIVAVTWVHSSTGVKLPIRAIADALADASKGRDPADRAILCVDGVHGIGVDDVTLPALGCDFFIAGCHKWLLGPRGTGFVWAKPEAWDLAQPTIPPFSFMSPGSPAGKAIGLLDGGRDVTGLGMTPGGFHSFEHRWALSEAFALHERIGKSRIADRIHALNRALKEGLAQMKHVTLHTPMSDELSAGIVCFEVAGMAPEAVVDRLREKKILASVTPYAVQYARLAAGLINDETDIEAALREVRSLA